MKIKGNNPPQYFSASKGKERLLGEGNGRGGEEREGEKEKERKRNIVNKSDILITIL